MTSPDECLERLKADWRAVARYRVYRASWYPEKKRVILATGLSFEEAKRRAADEYELLKNRDPKMQGRFGDDSIGFELEHA